MTESIIKKNLIFRIVFFLIYFAMTLNLVATEGINFISILFAAFAARDFVQAIRMGKFYLELRKKNTKNDDSKANNENKS